jgi:large conductance mechanosensitive channel
LVKGFRAFLLRGNLIDLAVAVVVGVAFNNVVQGLVKDLITPLISAWSGGPNFASLSTTIGHSTFSYGLFLNALFSFLLISAVVYFMIVAPVAKVQSLFDRRKAATERECPECLSTIPIAAKRCMYCTAIVPPVTASDTAPAAQPSASPATAPQLS